MSKALLTPEEVVALLGHGPYARWSDDPQGWVPTTRVERVIAYISVQAESLAEAQVRITAMEAELADEKRIDEETQEIITRYMEDAKRLLAENARLRESARVARRALEHDTCWADGQPANSSIDALVEGLVVCPACRAIKMIDAALSPAPPADPLQKPLPPRPPAADVWLRQCVASASQEAMACQRCGKPRTEAEGGKIFTVCDDCWAALDKEAPNA